MERLKSHEIEFRIFIVLNFKTHGSIVFSSVGVDQNNIFERVGSSSPIQSNFCG